MTNEPPPSDLPPVPELPSEFSEGAPQEPAPSSPAAPPAGTPVHPALPPMPYVADPDAPPKSPVAVAAPIQPAPARPAPARPPAVNPAPVHPAPVHPAPVHPGPVVSAPAVPSSPSAPYAPRGPGPTPPAVSHAPGAPAPSPYVKKVRTRPEARRTASRNPQQAPTPRVSALVVASLVAGVVALALAFVPLVTSGSWLLAAVGVVLGAIALIRRRRPRALAAAATALSALAFVLSIVLSVVYTAGLLASAGGGGAAPVPAPTAQDPDATTSESVPAVFGQTVTYDDQMQIAVSEPIPFTPSAEARGVEGDLALSFTVTIYNGTGADYELFPFTLVTADGQPGTVVVDEANSMPGVPPVATIAAGQTVTSIEGYSFPDGTGSSAVVYQVAPGPEYLPSRFTQ